MITRRILDERLHWPGIAKKVSNWRLKTPEKLREYVKIIWGKHWPQTELEPEIKLLLEGKSREIAREATKKKQEQRRQEEIEREERRYTFETPFIASDVWAGKKEGYVFKLGVRGQGYYEDIGLDYSTVNRAGAPGPGGKPAVKVKKEPTASSDGGGAGTNGHATTAPQANGK
eukprot:g12873.t1